MSMLEKMLQWKLSPLFIALFLQMIGMRILVRLGVWFLPSGFIHNRYTGMLLFLPLMLACLWIARRYYRRSFESMGLMINQSGLFFVLGLFLGFLLMFSIVLVNLLAHVATFSFGNNNSLISLIVIFGVIGIQSMTEEIIFRGFLLNGLREHYGGVLSLLISALAFMLIHTRNANFTGLAGINLFLIGLLFGLFFYLTDNIFFVTGVHLMWNFAMGCVFGVKVSGLGMPSFGLHTILLAHKESIHGGLFGFEAGLACSSILSIVLLVTGLGYLFYVSKSSMTSRRLGKVGMFRWFFPSIKNKEIVL